MSATATPPVPAEPTTQAGAPGTPAAAAPGATSTPPATPPAATPPAATPPAAAAATPPGTPEPGKDGKPPATPDPDAYTLTLPENAVLDAPALERTAANAKALGLSKEHAQKLAEHTNAEVAAYAQKQATEFEQVSRVTWPGQVKADPELGGENYERTVKRVERAMTRFAKPGLRKMLNETGWGNHPDVVAFCESIGAAMKDDSLVRPGAGGGPGGVKTDEEVFYDNTPKS